MPGLTGAGLTLRQLGDRFLASTAWLPGIVVFAVLGAIGGFSWWQAKPSGDDEVRG